MNFDDIYTYTCPTPEFYTNNQLISNINLLLDLPDVTQRIQGTKYDSATGEVLTSVGNEYSDIQLLPGATKLVTWVTEKLLETNKKAKSITYLKSWANMMFKDSEGLVHAHVHPDFKDPPVDFVAIFYVYVPENGSDLVFIKDGEFNTHYYDYPESKRTHIKVNTGELLIHSPQIAHAVSKHNSDIPRICLVFEGKYLL
jgi:hypothetical protein